MTVGLPSSEALCGLHNLLFEYADVQSSDFVLIAYRRECALAVAWMAAGLAVVDVETELLCLESSDETEFAHALLPPLLAREAIGRRIHLFVGENESLSFTSTLRQFLSCRSISVWRLMNLTPALFELGLRVTPETLKKLNAGLLHRLMKKHEIRILTGDDCQLTALIDPDAYQWISNYGRSSPGEMIALPAGEVNTYPASINGEFLADGAMHANISLPFDVRLHSRPVLLHIVDGAVNDFQCTDASLSRALDMAFSNDLCRRVGELGFGTNVGVTSFTRENTHINERYPGVHIGLGEHTQPGRVEYEAPIHIDMIARRSRVRTFDGLPDIEMSALEMSAGRHPEGTRGEDLEHVPA